MRKIKNWLSNEEGFEVFEKFGLTQGGVLLALGVSAVAIYAMSGLWSDVGDNLGGAGDLTPAGLTEYETSGWIQ